MKINNLKINGFGKLKDKEVNFKDGINLVYGENESGKSSMLKFISSMLYGASKNKNGKDISDFDKFKPWQTEEFSGKLEYTLDNGESFEVYREFKKKNPVIYNSKKEDISKTFTIDKTKGIEFFEEQTGIDEETFYNTAITEQEGIKLSKSSQNSIVQKISNLISSGDDNISFKKSLDKINKKQNEEVGTERTSQRPINNVENKIRSLINEKRNLETYRENIYDNSLEKEQLKLEEKDEEIKKEFLKEIKVKLDNNRIKSAEINFNRNLEKEYNEKIEELNKKISKSETTEQIQEINNRNYYIIIAIILITFVVVTILNSFKLINFVVLLPLIFVFYKMSKSKENLREKEKNRDLDREKVIHEIEVLRENRENQKLEAEEKQEKLSNEIEKDKNELIEKYTKFLDLGFMEENLDKNYDEILREIERKENRLNTIKFRLHTMEASSEEINRKLENLAQIEEELQDAETEKDELLSLNKSYNIAKECLERAYEQVKESISPRFTENLCDIISKISDGRYKNVVFSDTDGLRVEIQNGNYIPASRLSTGTIDQMYISLRLSALNEMTDEAMPIILDEAFAYFDNDRLANILKYLNNNFKENQIIIFTCSDREKDILNKLNIEYNIINLEK
ncbi:MAG: AAA family ATPase [Clostridia bacterium]|nr:AAA family ATPase [Clostridia bacterium]